MKLFLSWTIAIILSLGNVQLLGQGVSAFETALQDLPSFQLEVLTKVWRHDHPGFPTTAVRLGDINDDGYDDFVMTSLVDTVFIFYGGDSIDSDLDGYVLGGSNGATAADFNGDGIIDLATAASNLNRLGEPDPMRYGKIRVYYGSTVPPYFGPEPDMVLRGTKERDDFGFSSSIGTEGGLIPLDVNGDGQKDLMFRRMDWRDAMDRELAVLFGGAEFDTTVDLCIQKPIVSGIQSRFSEFVDNGDLNGDGRDDILAYYVRPAVPGKEQFLVYLGKTGGNYWSPDFIMENGATFFPRRYQSDITDANGDGYAEIITASGLLFRGFHLFMGSEGFTSMPKSDSIPNPAPDPIEFSSRVYPVGDMNGDGRDDFILGWTTLLGFRGLVYMVYPSGPYEDWRQAVGRIGILPDETHLEEGAYDVGDVNGDGYDDFAILGKPTNLDAGMTIRSRYWIVSGSPKLQTGIQDPVGPSKLNIEIYPNPANKSEGRINVRLPSNFHAPLTISISNLLGQRIFERRIEHETELPIVTIHPGALHAGVYQILVVSDDTHLVEYFVNR